MQPPLRTIIADDDRGARAALQAFLRTHPTLCTVVGEARDGAEALSEVARLGPDVLVIDLHMPVLDGLQATQIVKQRWPGIVIVAISMDAQEHEAALQAGADAFVGKTESPACLADALRKALEAAGRGVVPRHSVTDLEDMNEGEAQRG